ncbi:hypothetical protein [Aliiroseovarius sp. xm-g-7]|uniref:hypothetical protein n=1 Tax=Aliiroseovarius sp. xm-g-7 TaxID=2651826 RepID=UPI0015691826|nr:hypothetical protein [Aliiroseovarius sp. xm-g-7]NRQ25941.1 hypothetical protein [Aliiroseovarius sp. xm-g-7]
MTMPHKEAIEKIARRPAVHRLCYGAFLQAPVWISPDVLAVPLAPLGFEPELGYVAVYLRQFFGIEQTPEEVQAGRAQGAEALPVITVIHFPEASAPPQELEAGARGSLERAEQIIAWATGDRLTEFAYVTVTAADPPFFRMVPPHSRRRLRLGFGNTDEAFQGNVERIRQAADEDPRFAFAMAMFADAAHEPNPLFKVCRLFNVLESLAYALKGGPVKSRQAVKIMLGLEGGAMCNRHVDGREISYDRIEIAGRLRDKYFHGSPFREADLIAEARPVFYLIEHCPEIIADALLADCELALAKWANDASPARDAARADKNE